MHVGIGPRYGRRFAGSSRISPRMFGSALKMWFRADLGITAFGAAITAWRDQVSGLAYAAGTPPTLSTIAGLNNAPAVLGAGAATIMVGGVGPDISVAAPYTWVVVADHLAAATAYAWAESGLASYVGCLNNAGSFSLLNRDQTGTTNTDGATLGVTYYAGCFSSSGTAGRSSINGQVLTNAAATGTLFSEAGNSNLLYSVGAFKLAELILVQGTFDVRTMLAPYIQRRYGMTL